MCALATQRALLFSLQVQVQTPIIFQPGHIGRILKNCVFVCFVLQLFSFMFLRPPRGVSFHNTLTAHSQFPIISNTPSAGF